MTFIVFFMTELYSSGHSIFQLKTKMKSACIKACSVLLVFWTVGFHTVVLFDR